MERQAAIELLDSLELDSSVEIVSLSEGLYLKALDLFRIRPDKTWGLYEQAGFQALLR